MNLIQGKSNQYLREAILDGSLEKTKRMLTLKLGRADVNAATEGAGFSMLHVASLTGNLQIVMQLLQSGADIRALTDDGYSALDLAIWKGHFQVAHVLRSEGCVAPIKEPESLNGKKIMHLGKEATVVDFVPGTTLKLEPLRAIHYATGENRLVGLWAGCDYQIIGDDPNLNELRRLDYDPAAVDSVCVEQTYDDILDGQGFVDFDDSDSEDGNEIQEIVEIVVPPGPLGVLLNSGIQDRAVVQGFAILPSGQRGVIEQHGGVVPGMYIMSINDINASLMSLQQVTQHLGKLGRKEKTIRFAMFKPGSPKRDPQQPSIFTTTKTSSSSAGSSTANLPPLPPQIPVINSTSAPVQKTPLPPPPAPVQTPTIPEPVPVVQQLPTPIVVNNSAPMPSVLSPTNSEADCIHCGMPSSVHSSDDCPYK